MAGMELRQDLFIEVGLPEKHVTTMETYISFKIITKTTRGGDFTLDEYEVRRRYSDFAWLRQRLEDDNQTHLIPPLPEKHTLTKLDRFEAEFLHHRRKALQIFLTRIANHPVLSFNKNFAVFLTAKPWELQAVRKEGPGIMTRVNESFHTKTAPLVLGRGRRDPSFDAIAEFIASLRTNLTSIEKVASKLTLSLAAQKEGLSELAPLTRLMASSEEETELQKSLKALAEAVQTEHNSLTAVMKEAKGFIELGLHEYILYTTCIQEVLSRRDAIQLEYENTAFELRRKKEELISFGISSDDVSSSGEIANMPVSPPNAGPGFFDSIMGKDSDAYRRDKVQRVASQMADTTRLLNARSDRATCADADLKADMERWQADRKDDLVGVMTAVSKSKVAFHRKCLSSWEETLASFEALEIGRGESLLLSPTPSSRTSSITSGIVTRTEEAQESD